MRKRLSEEAVKRLKPPAAGKLVVYDQIMPGLLLVLNAGGSKSWMALHYRKTVAKSGKLKGQPVTMPTTTRLGRYPVMGLVQAREAARAFLADPQKAAEGGTVEEVAAAYMKRHVEAKGVRTRVEIRRCFDKYVLPHWRHRRLRDLKRSDLTLLLDGIEDDNGKHMADAVLVRVRAMMNWYASRNDDFVSPLARNMQRTSSAERKRSRFLDDDEVRALWVTADELGAFGAMCQTLLLTGQRRDKVMTMTWADLVDGTWVIATGEREKGNAGTLRLPPLLREIVEAQPRIRGEKRVFAASSLVTGKHALDRRMKALLGDLKPFTLHDLRRTARSLMARSGVQPHVAERVLGHAILGVEGVYDVHSYSREKGEALIKLADLVASIVRPPEPSPAASPVILEPEVEALATVSR
jgi:integrase